MTYFVPVFLGLVITLLNFVMPFLIPFALLTVKWDKEESLDRSGRFPAIRGDLPKWLS